MNGQINEHETPTDVVFLIEATSMNGTYINEMKTNYIQPILEHFNQGPLENNDNLDENRNCLYSIILYHAADIRPKPCCRTFGHEKDPQFVLSIIEKVRFIGGKAQSCANIGEGLATCLQFFDDIKKTRDGCQKYCILICNSPPNQMPVMENEQYAGSTLDQLACLFSDRKIFLSILSPRKIPPLFKLFEKTGGDLSYALSKSYSKNTRNLVLLNGICLKERAISPLNVTQSHNPITVPSPKSNPGNVGSPTPTAPFRQNLPQTSSGSVQHSVPTVDITSQQQQQQVQQQQTPQQSQSQPPLHPQPPLHSQQPQVPQQSSQQSQAAPPQNQSQLQPQQPQSNQQALLQQPMQHPAQTAQLLGPQQQGSMNVATRPIAFVPPNISQGQMNFPRGPGQPPGKWAVTGQQPRSFNPSQQSALIAQLQQPPSTMPPQFPQRYDGQNINQPNVNVMNQGSNQQVHQQFQQQLQQQQQQQQQPQMRLVGPNTVMNNTVPPGQVNPLIPSPQQPSFERSNPIWQGILEWTEKTKNPNNIARQIPCHISLTNRDKDIDLKADTWPQKLVMQLLPRSLLVSELLKKSTSVCFHLGECDAVESLKAIMNNGFAGCVQFNSPPVSQVDLKVLILLYTPEKDFFIGFIPNKQAAFLDNLRKLIQMRRNQANPQNQIQSIQGQPNQNPAGSQTSTNPAGMQQHMAGNMMQPTNMNNPMTGQQNHMGMGPGGPMIPGGPGSQQNMMHQNIQQSGVAIRANPMLSQRLSMPAEPDQLTRQKNLAQIRILQQQLSAAQQQEQMFQQQQQMEPQYVRHQLVNIQQGPQQSQQPRTHPNSMPSQPNQQYDDSNYTDFMN